jgi:putative sugar O-methyltransferase
MIQYSLRSLQRLIRSKLSIFFNKKEYSNPKIIKIIDEVYQISNNYLKLQKKNRKKTHKIFSKKVFNLIRKKQFLNFLQLSFIQQMFFVHNRLYLLSYLNELKNSSKWKLWKKLIFETNVGNPVRYFLYPKSSGNKIFQTYHLKKYEDFCKISLRKFNCVVEFGGGYGNMAATFRKINPNIKFIIFDTFEVNLLQYYYLKRNQLNINFNNQKNTKGIDLVNSLKLLKSKIAQIKKKNKTLLIANWSISETPLNLRKKIFFLFKEFDFQLISYQDKFENIDNKKFFTKIKIFNEKKTRKSKITSIEKMNKHYYLFCKK